MKSPITGWHEFARHVVMRDAAEKALDGDIELALWLASDDAEYWADMGDVDQEERLRIALLALVKNKEQRDE